MVIAAGFLASSRLDAVSRQILIKSAWKKVSPQTCAKHCFHVPLRGPAGTVSFVRWHLRSGSWTHVDIITRFHFRQIFRSRTAHHENLIFDLALKYARKETTVRSSPSGVQLRRDLSKGGQMGPPQCPPHMYTATTSCISITQHDPRNRSDTQQRRLDSGAGCENPSRLKAASPPQPHTTQAFTKVTCRF